jgi:hypothetical protein
VAPVLAPGGVPWFLTAGFTEDMPARLTPCGPWGQLSRLRAQGPAPKARGMPRPQLLAAQGVTQSRRRHLVRVRHRVVFGTLGAVQQVLAAHGSR